MLKETKWHILFREIHKIKLVKSDLITMYDSGEVNWEDKRAQYSLI